MDKEKEFKDLVREINLNRPVLEPFYEANKRGENFDFALAYAKESVEDRKVFKDEVTFIAKNMREQRPPWTKDRAARAWRDNIKLNASDSSVFPIESSRQGLDDWVEKNLVDFLRRYLTGWAKSASKKPTVTPVSPPPASIPKVVPATKKPPEATPKTVPAPPPESKKAVIQPQEKTPVAPTEIPKGEDPAWLDAKFRTLVKKIYANEEALRKHYSAAGFDFAAAYAKESVEGVDGGPPLSFEQEVAHIAQNMRGVMSKKQAIDKWQENVEQFGDEIFKSGPDTRILDDWVRKYLIDFLSRYYDGWANRPGVVPLPFVPPKSPPASTPSTPPEIVPKPPSKKTAPTKETPKPSKTEEESSTEITSGKEEEHRPFVQPFTLPKRGGVFRTVEELKGIEGFIERQDAFPTLEDLTQRAEKVSNACFGPKWQAIYTTPTNVVKLEGPQTQALQFRKKPMGLALSEEEVFMKSVDVKKGRGVNKEGLMDIVIGMRMNLLLQAKLVRGFVRMYDWYICQGEMLSEVKKRTGEIEQKLKVKTRIFTFQEQAPETLAARLMLALLDSSQSFLSGFAQLCLALEGSQNLLEYVHYDMHSRNVNTKDSETPDAVLRFKRPYTDKPIYVDLRQTEGKEVKIIDYGRNRIRSSYVYGDMPNEVIFLEEGFNLGISGRFHPQYDLRLYVIDFVQQLAIALPEQELRIEASVLEMLNLLAGSSYIRTTMREIEGETEIYKWNGKAVSGDFTIWANAVFNYSDGAIAGAKAQATEDTEVERILLEFKQGGLKYLHTKTREEIAAGKQANQKGYYPTAAVLVCFWAWTPMIWDGPTPSMILDEPLFDFLRESPEPGREIVDAVQYQSLQDFKIGQPLQTIGGPHGDWWPRLKSYWNSLPPQPQIQLEDFPDFYQIFAVNRILSHGSEGLLFEIEDLNPTVLGKQKRVLKLLPTIAFGREEYTRMLVNEARVHATIDKICVATPEFFGIFRIPVQPLRKLALGYDGALLQWDPSGKLSKETHMIAMIMEYIEGETLKTYIHHTLQNGQSLDETGLTAIALPLALQVKCLHDAGVVHRDLHMSNIMVDTEHQHQVRLIDFGMATSTEDPERFLKEGNWTYVPPEARGKNQFLTFWKKSDIDFKKMDVYSLGMILLKAGNPEAFKTEEIDDPFEYFPPKKMIPDSPYLSALVSRMLHPDPEKRPNIDSVIGTIIAAKPEFSETGEWYSWWNSVKVSAQRMWSLLLGSKENVKRQKHEDRRSLNRSRSPIRPHRQ